MNFGVIDDRGRAHHLIARELDMKANVNATVTLTLNGRGAPREFTNLDRHSLLKLERAFHHVEGELLRLAESGAKLPGDKPNDTKVAFDLKLSGPNGFSHNTHKDWNVRADEAAAMQGMFDGAMHGHGKGGK